ncbi:MAG: ABC transporter permease [Patescibacteria group bacterium]|nr:ABC transporter permease [Patescibacteria group bacterium]
MQILEQLKRSVAIAKKDLRIYYFRGPVVIQGLLIPTFILISFSYNRGLSFAGLAPMLLVMALFFTVSAITPVIAPWETRMRTFERLVSAPISLWAILLGDILGSVIFGLTISTIIIGLITLILGVGVLNFELILGTIIAAFCFSALGMLISAPPADKPSDIMLFSTIVKFAFLFISGIFKPISTLGNLKFLAYLSPLTYYNDLVKTVIGNVSEIGVKTDLLVLIGFSLVFYFVAYFWHKKNLDKRF